MIIVYILCILVLLFIGMALPATGISSGARVPHAVFPGAFPVAITIDTVDSYPNTWEHYSNTNHAVLPESSTPAYKHYARIPMNEVESKLMRTSQIRFDTGDFSFIGPQPANFITLVTRMCFPCLCICYV